jgi:hypothetical protein
MSEIAALQQNLPRVTVTLPLIEWRNIKRCIFVEGITIVKEEGDDEEEEGWDKNLSICMCI